MFDVASVIGSAGVDYEKNKAIVLKGKASILSGRVTAQIQLFGWEIELGASGDVGSIGGELIARYISD